jgi:BirA family transcriptional regulator, biotin operon repressor / biotin---[acetyl-CoA-carboxylase] ligase
LIDKSKIIYFDEINSTNTYLKNNFNNLSDFSLVFSDVQTHGRGREKRKWESLSKNFHFSLLLKDLNFLDFITHLPIFISIVLKNSILEYSKIDTKIKWPNDIYYKEFKLAGILIEFIKDNFIVGIGLNAVFSPNLANKNAISLKEIKKDLKINKEEFLGVFISNFNKLYKKCKKESSQFILALWCKNSMHINKLIEINEGLQDNAKKRQAKFLGLNEDGGARVIFKGERKEQVIYFGELDFEYRRT